MIAGLLADTQIKACPMLRCRALARHGKSVYSGADRGLALASSHSVTQASVHFAHRGTALTE